MSVTVEVEKLELPHQRRDYRKNLLAYVKNSIDASAVNVRKPRTKRIVAKRMSA